MDANLERGALRKLRFTIFLIFLAGLLAAATFAFLVDQLATAAKAYIWLAASGTGWLVYIGLVWRILNRNRTEDFAILLPRIFPADLLRLIQGWMLAGLVGFIFVPFTHSNLEWFPGLFLFAILLLDICGDLICRIWDQSTLLGNVILRYFGTTTLILGCLLLALSSSELAFVFAAGIVRVAFDLGSWFIIKRNNNTANQPDPRFIGWVTGVFNGFIGFALLPIFSKQVLVVGAVAFLLIFLGIYIQEFCILISWMPAKKRIIPSEHILYGLILLLLRLAVSMLMLVSPAFPTDASNFPIFMLAFTAVLGLFPRFGLLGILLFTGSWLSQGKSDTLYWLSFVLASVSFTLGGGSLGLWAPENRWINRED